MTARRGNSPDAVAYERLRTILLDASPALIEHVVVGARQFADSRLLAGIAESSLDFVASLAIGESPAHLPKHLQDRFLVMAHSEPDDWEIPAEVRQAVIHECFVFAARFVSERAFNAGIEKSALSRWFEVMRKFEALVQDHMAIVAGRVAAAKSARRRLRQARMLSTVLDDPAVHLAIGAATRESSARPPDVTTAAIPHWLSDQTVQVVPVVARPKTATAGFGALSPPDVALLPQPCVAALGPTESVLVLPASASPDVLPTLPDVLDAHRIAVGLAVPVADLDHGVAWCRRALSLRDQSHPGVTQSAESDVLRCDDIVVELLVGADVPLLQWVTDGVLAPFADLTDYRRSILLETLEAWSHLPNAGVPAVARHLDKHPQTVRYRLGQLRRLLGDTLDDEDQMFLTRLSFAVGRT